jgi:6-pyruvoyltetrahydropterin/6-carboxytetrahydropterin synthase
VRRFRVRVEKDYAVFCAGHFITYEGHLCEALHGHNYRVAAAVEGPLDENFYVLDFVRLKRLLKTVADRLDHRMLLPTRSDRIVVRQTEGEVVASYQDKRYVFPASDVVLLPIPNTTAEMLAQWIAGEIKGLLSPAELQAARAIEIEVEESFGQRAIYREERAGEGPDPPLPALAPGS